MTMGRGIMGPPRKAPNRPSSAGRGGAKQKPPLFASLSVGGGGGDDDAKKAGVKYVPSVRKQRPDPPPQPVLHNNRRRRGGNENLLPCGDADADDADVLCRIVPSQSNDATYRLGGKHVNQSNAAAHASGRCCCAHERRYMLGGGRVFSLIHTAQRNATRCARVYFAASTYHIPGITVFQPEVHARVYFVPVFNDKTRDGRVNEEVSCAV